MRQSSLSPLSGEFALIRIIDMWSAAESRKKVALQTDLGIPSRCAKKANICILFLRQPFRDAGCIPKGRNLRVELIYSHLLDLL